jgi:hypothetical protein
MVPREATLVRYYMAKWQAAYWKSIYIYITKISREDRKSIYMHMHVVTFIYR